MSNADDRCARAGCGSSRWSIIHAVTLRSPASDHHEFVEPCRRCNPAPQPAPSGDEAKVREIADRHCKGVIDFCNIEGFVGVSPHVAINAATREAYAAGKADGARAVTADIAAERDTWSGVNQIAWDMLDRLHRAIIARRGSEGK